MTDGLDERVRKLLDGAGEKKYVSPKKFHQGDIIGGRYRVQNAGNYGGMGVVYDAVRLADQKRVAVKGCLLCASEDDELYQWYLNEIFTTSRLSHAGLVSCLGTVDHKGFPYLVMEYLAYGLIEFFFDALGNHDEFAKRSYLFAVDLAEAVRYLTSEEVVHRDINPRNILATETLKMKLIDFGIAYDAKNPKNLLPQPGNILGKTSFVSPEGILHPEAPPLLNYDVYAVGFNTLLLLFNHANKLTLFQDKNNLRKLKKTLEHSFLHDSDCETFNGITSGETVLKLANTISGKCPKDFIDVLKEATLRDPQKRMNAGELVHELALLQRIFQ